MKYLYPSWHALVSLTAARTGCGAHLGVDWLVLPIIGINLDSGIGFGDRGDTADMPKSPVHKDTRRIKLNIVSILLKTTVSIKPDMKLSWFNRSPWSMKVSFSSLIKKKQKKQTIRQTASHNQRSTYLPYYCLIFLKFQIMTCCKMLLHNGETGYNNSWENLN